MKITIDRAVLDMALAALKKCDSALSEELAAWDIDPPLHHVLDASNACGPSIAAMQEALAQPQQEPVAWMHGWHDGEHMPPLHPHYSDLSEIDPPESVRPLVFGDTCPPARNPLTDDQWQAVSRKAREAFFGCKQDSVLGQIDCAAHAAIRAAEAAHGIKDTK